MPFLDNFSNLSFSALYLRLASYLYCNIKKRICIEKLFCRKCWNKNNIIYIKPKSYAFFVHNPNNAKPAVSYSYKSAESVFLSKNLLLNRPAKNTDPYFCIVIFFIKSSAKFNVQVSCIKISLCNANNVSISASSRRFNRSSAYNNRHSILHVRRPSFYEYCVLINELSYR
ncbi:hypothetical protein MCHI_000661 [Candidatus Magnetoovum chiemensis]|nr:hypothetical protein MCHI_000661 [Candidatus Magnetoovum chiemensis]